MELEPVEILKLERPLTDGEMVKLINHEGMVTLEDPHDIETAQKLAVDGLLLIFKPGMLGKRQCRYCQQELDDQYNSRQLC